MTDVELKRFAPILASEHEMFFRAFERYKDMNDSTIENAWAGMATLVHYRCFLDFYYTPANKRKYKDDVLAVDFNPNWSLSPPPWIEEERTMLNKMLAHLSMFRVDRIDRDEHYWNINNIKFILRIWKRFLDEIPAGRSVWFLRGELPS